MPGYWRRHVEYTHLLRVLWGEFFLPMAVSGVEGQQQLGRLEHTDSSVAQIHSLMLRRGNDGLACTVQFWRRDRHFASPGQSYPTEHLDCACHVVLEFWPSYG